MEIIYKKLNEIHPYEKNPRNNDEAVELVANSIKEFGFKNPIIVDKNNIIVSGHTRYKASQRLGLDEVPVIQADDLTDEQIKAFRIADNKVGEKATWNLELLELELNEIKDIDMKLFDCDFELNEQEIEVEVQDDNFEFELPEEPKAKRGDVYKLGSHYLMCGDSTKDSDVKTLLDNKQADCLFTDPPYNVDISNSAGMKIENDNMGDNEFKQFLSSAFRCASDNLKPGGAFYIWYADSEDLNFRNSCFENELLIKQCLIWVKNGINFGRQDYKWKHEPCLYGWKDGAGHYFVEEYNHPTVIEDKIDIENMKKEEMKALLEEIFSDKLATTIIHENKPLVNDLHPTMKPIRMCANMIRHSTKPGQTVLDLFGGSGSTMIACEQIGRNCFMMEYDPHYVDVIIERWEKFTGNVAVKIK